MSKADPDAGAEPAPGADRGADSKAEREARLARALRDNLRRRKAGEAADKAPHKD